MDTATRTVEKTWESLKPEEKLERRLEEWLSPPGIEFTTPQAEKDYRECVTRLTDAIQMKKTPDRVPILLALAGFAASYCGYTQRDIMYDIDKSIEVTTRCTLDFQADGKATAGGSSGRVYDILDYRLYSWPGHGIPGDVELQFNEMEYMKADEYDALIRDPSDYWMRTHIPRMMGVLEPFAKLSPISHVIEMGQVGAFASRYGLPEVQAALEKLIEAGREAITWQQKMASTNKKLDELGFPSTMGGFSLAPFDAIGDTLRGTRGIMRDIYRQPEKLLRAMEQLVPIMVDMGVSAARLGGCPIVMMPLHKGADGFISDSQFKTFYWPTLRQVIMGLIEEGLMVRLFAEGSYESRLEIVRDLPKGKTIWHFDYTNMALAKEILGDVACIQGNLPAAMIHTGTPAETVAYCRKLIDTAGKGGGYILSTGAGIGQGGKVENVRAMIQTTKEYGVYS